MTIKLTHEDVVSALTALVQEDPGRSNPTPDIRNPEREPQGCYYTVPGGGHCVAGEVIVRLGGSVPSWGDTRNSRSLWALTYVRGDFYFDIGITIPQESINLLMACQTAADEGATWGESVRAALEQEAS